jgi:hypothetical protein
MATQWYYKVMGEEFGPVSPSQLKQLALARQVLQDTLVRKGTEGDWVLAERVKGLFGGPGQESAASQARADDVAQPAGGPRVQVAGASAEAAGSSPAASRGRLKSLAVFIALGVATIVLGLGLVFGVFRFSAWLSEPSWPDGSGYLSGRDNTPFRAHDVEPADGELSIVGVDSRDPSTVILSGELEIRNSQLLFIYPGKQITHACESRPTLEVPDYNGDKCTLLYGMTARIDEYGKFVFVKCEPEGAADSEDAPEEAEKSP